MVAGRSAAARGPVARYLGLAAEAAGDTETAIADYEEAIAMSRRMGDRPFTAESSIELARVLLGRGAEGDAEQAAELLDSSLDAAQRLRMPGTSERALALKLEAQGLSGIDVEDIDRRRDRGDRAGAPRYPPLRRPRRHASPSCSATSRAPRR